MYDVIIIGAGAGGVSSAIYLKRAGLTPLVFTKKDGSSLMLSKEIENYYGTGKISGKTLFEAGIKQAVDLGIEMKTEEIFSILQIDGGFEISAESGSYIAKKVIIATGIVRKTPKVTGLEKFEGSGVSFCAVCDGFFYRKKTVAVLGSGKYAMHEAKYLAAISPKVYLLTNGEKTDVENDERITIIDSVIDRLEGENTLDAVIFKGGEALDIGGLFVAGKSAGGNELAKKLGLEMAGGHIKIYENNKTNISGIYAVGDCAGAPYQIVKAAYEGMVAASDIINSENN